MTLSWRKWVLALFCFAILNLQNFYIEYANEVGHFNAPSEYTGLHLWARLYSLHWILLAVFIAAVSPVFTIWVGKKLPKFKIIYVMFVIYSLCTALLIPTAISNYNYSQRLYNSFLCHEMPKLCVLNFTSVFSYFLLCVIFFGVFIMM